MASSKNKKPSKTIICSNGCNGKPKALSNFYKSNREEYEQYDGYCTTCKTCLRKSTVDKNLNTITMESIKDALRKLDKPLIESVFMEVKNNPETTNATFLGKYISLINLKPKYKDCRYSDTIDIQIEQEKVMNSKVKTKENENKEVTDYMKSFWGHGKETEDYFELQEMYDNFMEVEDEDSIDYKKQSDYKTLCELELMKRNMIGNGDKVADLSKVVDMISKLSSDLNIKAIQKKEDNSNKGAYDLFIKKIETTRPVFDWERDLGNKDEIKELLQLYFYGYLLDVNGQKTQFTDALYKDLSKYTPDLSSQQNEEEDDMSG